ncbi:DUF262 domain-containing protein [Coleofasciculus sp. FACHB-T130]|uniref:DUF262 domain-containing protein n=1 Tax=Cyanophyceae TaxID=3028117 RepID=UPI00168981CD|nr:DUF262 domain-containing protein [Coleofasciculus sp. FACHB-T130]MBD1880708.1 DUF262 domain-containing protein [Coleofasciculus sp. FACHB-T130]
MAQAQNLPPKPEITDKQKEAAEAEIREQRKPFDYNTKEYPIELLVQKYLDGRDDDANELFIPDYQRELVWDDVRQSKFIESVLLGLPTPYILVAEVAEDKNKVRFEIIDGTQRIRTLARFLNNELRLAGLEKLEKLNGFTFADLPLPRQRRFKRESIRLVEITIRSNEEVRRDIYERLNKDIWERVNLGSVTFNDMEVRVNILRGPLIDLIDELSKSPKFHKLCSFSEALIRRREPEEFVLRFFAYLNNYKNFERQVTQFLTNYLKENNNESLDREGMRIEFQMMLDFVEKYFPYGFQKGIKRTITPRIRFEAISVGVALALREKSDLMPTSIEWLDSREFKEYTTLDVSNSRLKVIRRIEFVRDQLLSKL